jgi:hypothetical protein
MQCVRRGLFALALVVLSASAAKAQWALRVATWNLLTLDDAKAGLAPGPLRENLLTRYAAIISQYDIIFLQEVQDGGRSVTEGITGVPLRPTLLGAFRALLMFNLNCQRLSVASGRQNYFERYSVCFAPNPAVGGTLVLNQTYDYANRAGVTFVPGDPAQGRQPAQNVWMRPPLSVTFTYTPPQHGVVPPVPVQFGFYTLHAKPQFERPRPPGINAGAPGYSSVFYELQGTENNHQVSPAAVLGFGVIGDLNSDCRSYPLYRRGQNFQNYTWLLAYGTRTNVIGRNACAYDQVIVSAGMNQMRLGPAVVFTVGIGRVGVGEVLDAVLLSDHYPVWFTIGDLQNQQQARI